MAVLTGDAAGALAAEPGGATAQGLLTRMESVPFSRWHMRSRIVMGSATFFDAFDALSMAFVLPVLIGPWKITSTEIGFLISASYLGQLIGALIFSRLAESYGRPKMAAAGTAIMSAGITTGTRQMEPAKAFIRHLPAPEAMAIYRAKGLAL